MRKKGMICFLILSALLILLPTAGHLLPRIGGETSVDENRALAQWPASARSLKIWLQSAESWLNDHLAFRDQLIEANLQMNLALGESPTSSVLLGRDGWLYLSEFDEARDVRREITLTPDEQDALVSRQTSLQELLKDGGAAYYVLIAPNKQTIYPEYLPLSLRPGVGETRLDQIYRTLAERTAVPFLDVRPALLAAKADQEVYYHYDHHWNETGGYYAFLALAQRLRQDFPTLYIPSPSEITTSPGTYPAGDVGRMIGLSGRYVDTCLWYHFPESRAALSKKESDELVSVYRNPDHPEAPRIVFVHDSFGPALVTFLKECASVLVETASDEVSWTTLLSWEPDIVIYEKVERYAMVLTGG